MGHFAQKEKMKNKRENNENNSRFASFSIKKNIYIEPPALWCPNRPHLKGLQVQCVTSRSRIPIVEQLLTI